MMVMIRDTRRNNKRLKSWLISAKNAAKIVCILTLFERLLVGFPFSWSERLDFCRPGQYLLGS